MEESKASESDTLLTPSSEMEAPETVTYSPSGQYRLDFYYDYVNCVRVADGKVIYTHDLDQLDVKCFLFQRAGMDWLMVSGIHTGSKKGSFKRNPDLEIAEYSVIFMELATETAYEQATDIDTDFMCWRPNNIYPNIDLNGSSSGTILAISCYCKFANTSNIIFLNFQDPKAWSAIKIRESEYYPILSTKRLTWLGPDEAIADYKKYSLLLTYRDGIMHSQVLDQTDLHRQTIQEQKGRDYDRELYREMLKQSNPYFRALYEAFPPEHDPPRDYFEKYLYLPMQLKPDVDPSIPPKQSDYQYYTWDCPPEAAPFEYRIHQFEISLTYKDGKIEQYDSVEDCIADIRAKYASK